MKKNIIYNNSQKMYLKWQILLAIFFFLTISSNVISNEPIDSDDKIAVGEQIQLLTDRNLYTVQEQVYFNALYSCPEEIQDIDWSKVLYIELLSQDGQVELQQKLPLDYNGAFGSFILPKELLTGYYYLRAYTKWMANFGPEAFPYLRIIVVNPFNEQTNTNQSDEEADRIILNNTSNYQIAKSFTINNTKGNYKKREKVTLGLNLGNTIQEGDVFTISVVKTSSLDSVWMAGSINTKDKALPIPLKSVDFLPESRGLCFSGSMNYEDGQSASERKTVNLSVIGENPYFAQTNTNAKGEFQFTIPRQEGDLNLFLCPSGREETDVVFKVNDGFVNYHYPIESSDFSLNDEQRELAKELVINAQLANIYPQDIESISVKDSSISDSIPLFFYGTPETRLFLDEYIVLPNLGEVFFELVPNVLLLKKKKVSYLEVVNENLWSSSLPMVLLDHIPIYDLNTILGINSQKFEWIDVVNTNYLKGGKLYSGIISIFSRNNDIAGAELPEGGAFFSYKAFEEQKQIKEIGNTREEKNIPDLRNCLYWDPNYTVTDKQNTEIEFYTSDNTGEYTVLIRKLSTDGGSVELGTSMFVVE